MKCEFCGGVVSWVGNLIDNLSTECKDCGRRNCQVAETAHEDDDSLAANIVRWIQDVAK